MDHDSIRHKLSEYLDGAVTPAEKLLIEKHLAKCSDCRKSLRELEKTVRHLRNLGELEPPPWLAVRIMARVREEAGREKGLLRRLLHLPLRWRVSVEAVALVFLCVTGYLVYRNVSSELPQITPLSGVPREESAPVVPPVVKPQKHPEVENAPEMKKPPAAMAEKLGAGSVPLALPEEKPFAEQHQEELEPPAPSPAEVPFRAENKGTPDFRMQERSAAKSLSPSDEFSLPEKKNGAPSGLVRNKALPSSGVETLRLELLVADADSVQQEVERATVRFGGIIQRRDFSLAGESVFVIQLQRKAVQGYIKLLKKLGEVRGTVSTAPEGDDTVEVYLAVTTRRE